MPNQSLPDMPQRCRFAGLIRIQSSRRVGGPERPHRWHPGKVLDPITGYGMTDAAAWSLLARKLEDPKQKIEVIELRQPAGCTGYVMKLELNHLEKRVYAKFEFIVTENAEYICARSFHPEDPR